MAAKKLYLIKGIIVRTNGDYDTDLTTVLKWCETHQEPVWVYRDGTYKCPYDLVVESNTKDHDITDFPYILEEKK